MGLLDDAIREHLELKRRRGADPGEVAHQERAALDPVYPSEPEAIEDDLAAAPPAADADVGMLDVHDEELASGPGPGVVGERAEAPSGPPHAGQETAELDMEEVLAADLDAEPHESVSAAGPPEDPSGRADDSLEWEIPRRAGQEALPEDSPGQERLSFE